MSREGAISHSSVFADEDADKFSQQRECNFRAKICSGVRYLGIVQTDYPFFFFLINFIIFAAGNVEDCYLLASD